MINAVNDTSLLAGQKINDPASMLLAVGRAQSVAQTNAAWLNNGKVAEQALPVIRNTIEAIVYAIFPIVILLLLMTGGRETMIGLKNYLSVLIWIQLWPPLYAILNYMAMVHAARELAAAASVGNGISALSLMTSSSIYSGAISGEAVVGYMTMSIPVIAWAGLKRMETFGSALIGGVATLQSVVSSTTGSAATGSVSLGNTSMDQMAIAPTRSSAFFHGRQNDTSGNIYTSNALSGLTSVKALANEGPVSRVVDTKVSQQHVIAANSAVTAARSESIAASREKAAALSEVVMNAATRSMSHASSEGSGFGSSETEGARVGALQQIARNVSKTTGASEQQVAAVAFGGSAYLSAGIPSAAGKFLPFDGGGQISATGRKSYSASIQQQDQLISTALSSEDKAKFKAFADTVTKNTGVIDSLVSDAKKGHELSARHCRKRVRSPAVHAVTSVAQDLR
ncbi:conjugal transfer protein TraG N-terminal domain-containing protein [Pseudoduganella sp. UC29_106]|uniref:conjugal transfer protein TraG N-terminal domain-containing protein n=1 Tax=Pseudoduganella sp. UC29_106 TaxID=3374553 RepID=UPI003756396D